jgi:hypothetical protein
MNGETRMKRFCDSYIRWVGVIGALYCAIPTVIWFGGMFLTIPFRSVYVLRLLLSLILGTPLASFANSIGLRFWLTKHRSAEGPATVLDGALIGAACGMATALLPPLTSLLASHHLEEAKTFIISAWLAAMGIGAVLGGTLASVGRKHLAPRTRASRGENAR